MNRDRVLCWASALIGAVAAILVSGEIFGNDRSEPLGDPVLDPPTCESLGVYWIVRGDDNRSARIDLAVRRADGNGQAGKDGWQECLPLLRVEKGAHLHAGKVANDSSVKVPEDGWLFAGSALFLDPDTAYEIRLRLSDSDGGKPVEQVLKAHTVGEPVVAAQAPRKHVIPGDGGGDGSTAAPFKGLASAQMAAKPGDVFVVQAGTYPAFTVSSAKKNINRTT